MSFSYIWAKALTKLRGAAIKRSNIHASSKVESGSVLFDVTMGRHSFCGYDCEIVNCEIGSFCSIASNVRIGGGAHPVEWVSTSPVFYEGRDSVKAKFAQHSRTRHKRTVIGHDVWVGADVHIKQGVVVGTGSVIGMGSVVTRDIPPYTIFGGVPAKLIRQRFASELANRLLASEWWLLSDADLRRLGHLVTSPEQFLRALGK